MLDPNYISVYSELNIFCLIILAIIGLGTRIEDSDNTTARSHTRAILATCAFIVTDALWFTMNAGFFPRTHFSLMIIKSLYFLSTTFMCYCWFICFERRQGISDDAIERNPLYVPSLVAIHLVLLIANAFFGFFFSYTPDLTYVRGPFFLVQYVLAYGYVLLCSLMALKRALGGSSFSKREYHVAMALFPVPPAICGVIQYFAPSLPCACCGMTISALVMYLSALTQLVSRDSLTGLNNRRQMLRDIESSLSSRTEPGSLWVILGDLDDFKQINDRRGHTVGDRALEICGRALKHAVRCAPGRASIYRYGGDEFIMLVPSATQEDLDNMCATIRTCLDEECAQDGGGFELGMSLGYASNQHSDNARALLKAADAAMYQDKRARTAGR